MNVFKKRADVQDWLETQPRDIISVFAARAALRALPHFVSSLGTEAENRHPENIILPSIWAAATALSAGHWPDRNFTAAANAAFRAVLAGPLNVDDAISNVARASTEAAAAVTAGNVATAAAAAAFAAGYAAAAFASDATFTDPYFEYSLDRNIVLGGGTAQTLAEQKLWHKNITPNALMPNDLQNSWFNLKAYLEMLNGQEWEVWTDWYKARLKGEPLIEELEIGVIRSFGTGSFGQGNFGGQKFGRVTFPSEDYKDPAIINPKIKAMIEDYWTRHEQLKQDVSAEAFTINENGQIDLDTAQTSLELIDTPTQRDWYESLRQSAASLQEVGVNALGRAARPVSNLLDALPENLPDAKVARLWPAANRIRRLKSAHDKAIALGDDYHPNLLSSEVVDDIDQFVGVYNNLLLGDENLALADQKALGPRDQSEIIEANNIASGVISEAIEYELLTDEAREALGDVQQENLELAKIKNESGELSILEQLALDNNARINDNAMRAFIVRVRDSKIYNNKGTIFASAVASRMLEYAVAKFPSLVNLIRPLFGF